jgi:hypothetical protein
MKKKIIIITIILKFCLSACSNIEGSYVSNNNEDTLELFSNGTYKRKHNENGEVLVIDGKWKKETKDIFFYNWFEYNKDSIIRGMKVEKSLFNKEVRLYTDYDNDSFYRKIR